MSNHLNLFGPVFVTGEICVAVSSTPPPATGIVSALSTAQSWESAQKFAGLDVDLSGVTATVNGKSFTACGACPIIQQDPGSALAVPRGIIMVLLRRDNS